MGIIRFLFAILLLLPQLACRQPSSQAAEPIDSLLVITSLSTNLVKWSCGHDCLRSVRVFELTTHGAVDLTDTVYLLEQIAGIPAKYDSLRIVQAADSTSARKLEILKRLEQLRLNQVLERLRLYLATYTPEVDSFPLYWYDTLHCAKLQGVLANGPVTLFSRTECVQPESSVF